MFNLEQVCLKKEEVKAKPNAIDLISYPLHLPN